MLVVTQVTFSIRPLSLAFWIFLYILQSFLSSNVTGNLLLFFTFSLQYCLCILFGEERNFRFLQHFFKWTRKSCFCLRYCVQLPWGRKTERRKKEQKSFFVSSTATNVDVWTLNSKFLFFLFFLLKFILSLFPLVLIVKLKFLKVYIYFPIVTKLFFLQLPFVFLLLWKRRKKCKGGRERKVFTTFWRGGVFVWGREERKEVEFTATDASFVFICTWYIRTSKGRLNTSVTTFGEPCPLVFFLLLFHTFLPLYFFTFPFIFP